MVDILFPSAGVVRRMGFRAITGGQGFSYLAPWAWTSSAAFTCRVKRGSECVGKRPVCQPLTQCGAGDTDFPGPLRKAERFPTKCDFPCATAVLACHARCGQRIFHRPAPFKAILKGLVRHSELCGPLGYALSHAVERHKAIAASISQLLCPGGPTAILRFVVSIIVDPLNGMPRRGARPHVTIEGLKRVPCFTDRNATASIVAINVRCDTPTTRSHSTPDCIFRRFTQPVAFGRIVVSHLNLLNRFMVVRTTGRFTSSGCLHFTTSQVGGQDYAA